MKINSSVTGGIAYVHYFEKNKFLFEGLHVKISTDYEEQNYYNPTYKVLASEALVGYGWHYFNHTLLLKLNVGMIYSVVDFDNSNETRTITRGNIGGTLAFIF